MSFNTEMQLEDLVSLTEESEVALIGSLTSHNQEKKNHWGRTAKCGQFFFLFFKHHNLWVAYSAKSSGLYVECDSLVTSLQQPGGSQSCQPGWLTLDYLHSIDPPVQSCIQGFPHLFVATTKICLKKSSQPLKTFRKSFSYVVTQLPESSLVFYPRSKLTEILRLQS